MYGEHDPPSDEPERPSSRPLPSVRPQAPGYGPYAGGSTRPPSATLRPAPARSSGPSLGLVALLLSVCGLAGWAWYAQRQSDGAEAARRAQAERHRAAESARTRAAAEEMVRRMDERHGVARRMRESGFNAMTPAEHMAYAQAAMVNRYNARDRVGGDLDEAGRHLEAIPAGARERARATELLREVEARRARAEHLERLPVADALLTERMHAAAELERGFSTRDTGVDAVRTAGESREALRITAASCGAAMLERWFAAGEARRRYAAIGFQRVECFDGASTATLVLTAP